MKIPCSLDFGLNGGFVVFQCHVLEEGILGRLVLSPAARGM